MQIAEFCREIETYLCRKNDGHLIRVVGPSFEIVSRWAAQGVPLKVAFKGIDRYFERYYSKGPRRRPVKIDFCEADVLDVFDEWRRATGIAGVLRTQTPGTENAVTENPGTENSRTENPGTENREPGTWNPEPRQASLPKHLERAVMRLTSARAGGTLDERFDRLIDEVSRELDLAKTSAGGLRGDARRALVARLDSLDAELIALARQQIDSGTLTTLAREAAEELAPFREGMAEEAFARAKQAAIDRAVRERFGLPTVAYT